MNPRGFALSLIGALVIASTPLTSPQVMAHENLRSENYPFKITFVKKLRSRYPAGSAVVKGADLFLRHRWIQAKEVFESIKKPDVTTLFFLYTINKSFGLNKAMNDVIYQLARIPASRLKLFNSLMLDREIKRVVYHYHRDHLTETAGPGRALAMAARSSSPASRPGAEYSSPAVDPASEWEVRPVVKDSAIPAVSADSGTAKPADETAPVEKAESTPADTAAAVNQ